MPLTHEGMTSSGREPALSVFKRPDEPWAPSILVAYGYVAGEFLPLPITNSIPWGYASQRRLGKSRPIRLMVSDRSHHNFSAKMLFRLQLPFRGIIRSFTINGNAQHAALSWDTQRTVPFPVCSAVIKRDFNLSGKFFALVLRTTLVLYAGLTGVGRSAFAVRSLTDITRRDFRVLPTLPFGSTFVMAVPLADDIGFIPSIKTTTDKMAHPWKWGLRTDSMMTS